MPTITAPAAQPERNLHFAGIMFTTGIVLVFLRDTFKDLASKLELARYVSSPAKRSERDQYSAPVRA